MSSKRKRASTPERKAKRERVALPACMGIGGEECRSRGVIECDILGCKNRMCKDHNVACGKYSADKYNRCWFSAEHLCREHALVMDNPGYDSDCNSDEETEFVCWDCFCDDSCYMYEHCKACKIGQQQRKEFEEQQKKSKD